MDAEALMALAETAHVRVVVIVGDGEPAQIEVRSTSHHRGNLLLARLDGLPVPLGPAEMAQVTPLLKIVVGATGATEVEIPALDWKQVGARWGVLAEWLRAQQGHHAHEDRIRREELARALDRMLAEGRERGGDDGVGFYRDLAVLVRARTADCGGAEPTLRELSTPKEHEAVIRASALLGRVACLLEGDDAASNVEKAEALLAEALDAGGENPCVRVAAIGSISQIDRWRGGDALWEANAERLPGQESCEPAMWSQGLAVRGDALVDRERWCDAAKAYARAYGALRTRAEPLLNWAEYDWVCKPERGVLREDLLQELGSALASTGFERPEQRVSIAYMRWWLTRDPTDAKRVVDEHAEVEEGEVALIEGVASSLEQEICKGAEGPECSRRILARPKERGDDERLRSSLGLR
jgi:hypothetical protein